MYVVGPTPKRGNKGLYAFKPYVRLALLHSIGYAIIEIKQTLSDNFFSRNGLLLVR